MSNYPRRPANLRRHYYGDLHSEGSDNFWFHFALRTFIVVLGIAGISLSIFLAT
jgi:hypothetical protein